MNHRDLHSFPTRRSSDLPSASKRWGMTCCPVDKTDAPSPKISFRAHSGTIKNAGRFKTSAIFRVKVRLRSEEHTSELQSRPHLVCRLLLEKKKQRTLYSK